MGDDVFKIVGRGNADVGVGEVEVEGGGEVADVRLKSPRLVRYARTSCASLIKSDGALVKLFHVSNGLKAAGAGVMVLAISVPVVSQPTTLEHVVLQLLVGEAVQKVEQEVAVAVEQLVEVCCCSPGGLLGSLLS
jgi:hypothetical protein